MENSRLGTSYLNLAIWWCSQEERMTWKQVATFLTSTGWNEKQDMPLMELVEKLCSKRLDVEDPLLKLWSKVRWEVLRHCKGQMHGLLLLECCASNHWQVKRLEKLLLVLDGALLESKLYYGQCGIGAAGMEILLRLLDIKTPLASA